MAAIGGAGSLQLPPLPSHLSTGMTDTNSHVPKIAGIEEFWWEGGGE